MITIFKASDFSEDESKSITSLKLSTLFWQENKDLNSTRRKKETERLNSLMERLQEEEKRHKVRVLIV